MAVASMVDPVTDKPASAQLGELVQRARVARGLSHRDVAERIGVGAEDVRQIEIGKLVPDGRMWARLKGSLYALRHAAQVWQAAVRAQEPLRAAGDLRVVEQALAYRDEAAKQPRELASDRHTDIADLPDPRRCDSFGEALRCCRVNGGLTGDDVGELVGVTGQAVSAWETGKQNPIRMHYDVLLQVWPELADCPVPAAQDITKPGGGGGMERDSVIVALAPPESATRQIREALDRIAATPTVASMIVDITSPIEKAGIDYALALTAERSTNAELSRVQQLYIAATTAHHLAVAELGAAHDRLFGLASHVTPKGIQ